MQRNTIQSQERGLTPSEASRPASKAKDLHLRFLMIWKLNLWFFSKPVILCGLAGWPRGFWRCQAPFLISNIWKLVASESNAGDKNCLNLYSLTHMHQNQILVTKLIAYFPITHMYASESNAGDKLISTSSYMHQNIMLVTKLIPYSPAICIRI